MITIKCVLVSVEVDAPDYPAAGSAKSSMSRSSRNTSRSRASTPLFIVLVLGVEESLFSLFMVDSTFVVGVSDLVDVVDDNDDGVFDF